VSVRDVIAALAYQHGVDGMPFATDILAALRAAGYAVVPVGQTCPFDRIDHGGLAPEDPCPVCGDIGTPATDDQPSRCISGQARAMIAAAQEPGP